MGATGSLVINCDFVVNATMVDQCLVKKKGAAGCGKGQVKGGNYLPWLPTWFEYWGKGGQIYFLTKSDGMHSSEVRRVCFKDGGPH